MLRLISYVCLTEAPLAIHAFNSASLAMFSLWERYLMSVFELITWIALPLNSFKQREKRVSEKRPECYHGERALPMARSRWLRV